MYRIMYYLIHMYHTLTPTLGELMRTQGLGNLKLARTPSLVCTKRQLTQKPTPTTTLKSQDHLVITLEENQDPLTPAMVLHFLF